MDDNPNLEPDIPPPLDIDALAVEDAEMPAHGIPNAKAGKPKRSWIPTGDKRDTAVRRTPKKKPSIPRRKGMFVQPLEQMYVGLGLILMPIDPVCANAVLASAENCARTLDELAYQNDAVRRVLWSLIQTSTVGAVIFAHIPILTAVMMHHVPAVQNALGVMGQQMADSIIKQSQPVVNPDGENE